LLDNEKLAQSIRKSPNVVASPTQDLRNFLVSRNCSVAVGYLGSNTTDGRGTHSCRLPTQAERPMPALRWEIPLEKASGFHADSQEGSRVVVTLRGSERRACL
jgi:hypothetical protein